MSNRRKHLLWLRKINLTDYFNYRRTQSVSEVVPSETPAPCCARGSNIACKSKKRQDWAAEPFIFAKKSLFASSCLQIASRKGSISNELPLREGGWGYQENKKRMETVLRKRKMLHFLHLLRKKTNTTHFFHEVVGLTSLKDESDKTSLEVTQSV